MPYIPLQDRPKFKDAIEALVNALINPNETLAAKGEYFGYYVRRLTSRYVNSPRVDVLCKGIFHSRQFPEDVRKLITNIADQVALLVGQGSALETAGLLNYAITTPLWGLLGDAEEKPVGYGMRAYLKGILLEVYKWTDDLYVEPKNDSPTGVFAEAVIAYRKKLVVQGVLHDVIAETDRKKTGPYEDGKIKQNGDLWVAGELNVR